MTVIHVYQTPQAIYLTQGIGSPNQNYPVNRCDFRIYRGVRNDIEVFIKDLDRKPVFLSDGIPVMRIMDRNRQTVLYETVLTDINSAAGRYRLIIEPSVKLPLGTHIYVAMVEVDGESPTALFTDRDRGITGIVEVVSGTEVFPPPAPEISKNDMLLRDLLLYTTALPGAAQNTHQTGLHTAMLYMDGFTGAVTVQASLEAQPESSDSMWFDVSTTTFDRMSGVRAIEFEGMYVWVRYVVRTDEGNIVKVVHRN